MVPQFLKLGAILTHDPPESYLQKNKLLRTRDEKSHGLGAQRESCEKNDLFPTILGQGDSSFENHFRRKVLLLQQHASSVYYVVCLQSG